MFDEPALYRMSICLNQASGENKKYILLEYGSCQCLHNESLHRQKIMDN